MEGNGKKADPEALYFIETGTVDVLAKLSEDPKADEGTMEQLAAETVTNISKAVSRLVALGARHVLVGNSFAYDEMPGSGQLLASEQGTDNYIPVNVSAQVKAYQTSMNAELPSTLEELANQLNVKIEVFDFTAIEGRIRSNPEQYGLTNIYSSCTEHPYSAGYICAKPDEYYYWGLFDLSGRVHQILGEAMAEQLSK